MLLKQQFFPLGVSATWNHYEHREQRHLADKLIVYKTNKKYYDLLILN